MNFYHSSCMNDTTIIHNFRNTFITFWNHGYNSTTKQMWLDMKKGVERKLSDTVKLKSVWKGKILQEVFWCVSHTHTYTWDLTVHWSFQKHHENSNIHLFSVLLVRVTLTFPCYFEAVFFSFLHSLEAMLLSKKGH